MPKVGITIARRMSPVRAYNMQVICYTSVLIMNQKKIQDER